MKSITGFCLNRCYEPTTIMAISMVLMAGAGIYETTQGMKQEKMPGSPAAPDPSKAGEDAKAAQDKQRRILLATGGQTNYTGGQAAILGDNINSINLTGT